jgi:hypothetical protein
MPSSSQSVTYNTIAALALDKLSPVVADNVSTGTKLFYFMKKSGNWEGVSSGGRQLRKAVMSTLMPLKPLGSFGTVNVNPVDGDTAAYFAWVQTAAPITFADMEEFQTGGTEAIETIVESKRRQAEASIIDIFNQALLRGQGAVDGVSLDTALTSSVDGSVFISPLPLFIKKDPTTSTTVGGIDQSANPWWRNQTTDANATTLAVFLNQLRFLHVKCQRGGGGANSAPDFHCADERTYTVYEKALALGHRNPDYSKGDIPFDTTAFKGKPVFPDEQVPDVQTGSTTITKGTWYMGNSAWMGFTYDQKKSFKTGDSIRPNNQLLETALMPIRGAFWINNRRKLGVAYDIDLTALEAATT